MIASMHKERDILNKKRIGNARESQDPIFKELDAIADKLGDGRLSEVEARAQSQRLMLAHSFQVTRESEQAFKRNLTTSLIMRSLKNTGIQFLIALAVVAAAFLYRAIFL